MKRAYLLICTLLTVFLSINAQSTTKLPELFHNETLSYVIQYKWGFIQKNAATASIRLHVNPKTYAITLTAKTDPWADGIFALRDTLQSLISRTDFRPISYTKATHENGKYRRDYLTYKYVGKNVYGTCQRTKRNPGGPTTHSTTKCSATGPTYDMASIFYYVRSLDFAKISKTTVVKATIFSGSAPEIIKIRNLGVETCTTPNGKKYTCYHIQFTFTTEAGTKTSNPMDIWMTTDAAHIPVKMVGTLPIGKVRCFLTSVSNS